MGILDETLNSERYQSKYMDTDTHSVCLFERVIYLAQLGTIIFSGSDQEPELPV